MKTFYPAYLALAAAFLALMAPLLQNSATRGSPASLASITMPQAPLHRSKTGGPARSPSNPGAQARQPKLAPLGAALALLAIFIALCGMRLLGLRENPEARSSGVVHLATAMVMLLVAAVLSRY